jgi:anaerobic magnesium-protoporphyrin IX monomethyl ester cyclase
MQKPTVLFTHSYFLQLDPKQLQWNKPYPPLMTIQAAALMREAGYLVRLFDTMFADGPESIEPALGRERTEMLVIFDDGFNYLTKMCLTNMREAAWAMACSAKARGCVVIACSSDATDHAEAYLANGVDYVLAGEGELTLLELADALHTGQPLHSVKGIVYMQDGRAVRNPPRPAMKDLDALPLPAWDLVDLEAYKRPWKEKWGYFSINIATTRGCPYKCNWCAKPIYGNKYAMRSPQHVVREIEFLQKLFPFDHIWFCDDIFGLKRSWVVEFARLVEERGLRFEYKIQSRADLLVKDRYVEALATSGCREAWMGVESGSQRILDAMDKGITIEEVRLATARLKDHGIRPCFFIQFGYLGEKAEDIKMTIDLIEELLPHDIGISISYPLPGTLFYDKVRQDLKQKANWTDSDDLDLMFRNTYEPGFYKQLHRFVHLQFRKKLALAQLRRLFLLNIPDWKRALSVCYYAPAAFFAKRRLKAIDHEAASRL